jgi:hypothetical protein
MRKVEELELQIQKLSREEFAELRECFWSKTGKPGTRRSKTMQSLES